MGYGQIHIKEDSNRILEELDAVLAENGLFPFPMTQEEHPTKMKAFSETKMRLFWIAPRLNGWAGLFEYRYYTNEKRKRWGYTDDALAAKLSERLHVPVLRLELLDTAGFWMYSLFEEGKEKEGKVWEDLPGKLPSNPDHPRFELNRIVEREGLSNIGLCYENIPGPMVAQVENCEFWEEGIEGEEDFTHRAYRTRKGT